MRVAVVDKQLCQPRKCNTECVRFCPRVRGGVLDTIKIDEETGKAIISEELCTGCGICVNKCPFKAIRVVNLPEELKEVCVHQYGLNSFRLYRLPVVRLGKSVGVIGRNGVGKSTALSILSGTLKPNLGDLGEEKDWSDVAKFFKGSELQKYFEMIGNGEIRVSYKPQNVSLIPRVHSGKVEKLLQRVDERGVLSELTNTLEIEEVLDREISSLSGGELQRVAIAAALSKEADLYILDEPCSFVDVYQRINVAKAIREISEMGKGVVLVEHDATILDFISDYVHVIYGEPGVYGIVSSTYSVREGVNSFLQGYLKTENVKIREYEIKFEIKPPIDIKREEDYLFKYPSMKKCLNGFSLEIASGGFYKGEIIGVLGPNGIGKTTFARILAGELEPDSVEWEFEEVRISHKPQYIDLSFEGTVEDLLRSLSPEFGKREYEIEIISPLKLKMILEREISSLSGGELQRVAIAAALSKEADLYILDEPTAFLDLEERINLSRIIRRIIEKKESVALVIDHDIQLIDVISDRIMIFRGEPGKRGLALPPSSKREGMNTFLRDMDITYRRDPVTGRPRINKPGSRLDREQREKGDYYYVSGDR